MALDFPLSSTTHRPRNLVLSSFLFLNPTSLHMACVQLYIHMAVEKWLSGSFAHHQSPLFRWVRRSWTRDTLSHPWYPLHALSRSRRSCRGVLPRPAGGGGPAGDSGAALAAGWQHHLVDAQQVSAQLVLTPEDARAQAADGLAPVPGAMLAQSGTTVESGPALAAHESAACEKRAELFRAMKPGVIIISKHTGDREPVQ